MCILTGESCHSSSGYGIWWGRAQIGVLSGSKLRGKLIYTDLDWIPAPELDIHVKKEVISLDASVCLAVMMPRCS